MKPERCKITVQSTYCQKFMVNVLAQCLKAWGWSIRSQDDGGFEATLR